MRRWWRAAIGIGCFLCLSASLPAAEAIPRMIAIGAPGNPPDENGYGAVGYPYEITRSRVLNRHYARFLNEVDPTGENRLDLYDSRMASSQGGIVRDEAAGEGERYRLKPGRGDQPVFHVDWPSAARFANWLENGATPQSDTGTGSYDLIASEGAPTIRQPGARYVVANENEWYKAAWYYPGSGEEGATPPGYSRLSRWPKSVRGGAVGEVVDRAPRWDGLQPVAARGRERLFPQVWATSPRSRRASDGFRIVALPTARPDGKEVLPPVVGEEPPPVGEAVPVYSYPGLWPGGLFMWPPGVVIDREIEERDPAS